MEAQHEKITRSNPCQLTRQHPSSTLASSSASLNGRHRRRLRQCPLIFVSGALLLVLVAAFIPSSLATATHNAFTSSLLIDDTIINNDNPTNNNAKVTSTKQQPQKHSPPNFLRWRSLQQITNITADENKTNDDWNITSNDYNNDTGVYVTFPSFGLQLGPMMHSLVSSTSRSSSSSSSANELSNAIIIQQSMAGLHYAIESYLNMTFRQTMGEIVNGTNYTTGKFMFGNVDPDVKFVSECQYTTNGEGGGESLRTLEQAQQQTNITVYIPGGQAFYVFGVGGWWMETIPTSEELYQQIIESVLGKEDGMGGGGGEGGLAGWIQSMAVNGPESMMMMSDSDVETHSSMEGDLAMFQRVQGVKVIEGLTLPPTVSPASYPADSIEDETTVSANMDDDALIEDTEVIDVESEHHHPSSVGDHSATNNSEGGDANDNVDKAVIAEANSSSVDGNGDANGSKIFIVAGALSCLLVLSAAIGLFFYRRRHRNDNGSGELEGDGTKIVPMSMMSDENDFYRGYSDAYNGLFSAAGGGVGDDDMLPVVDIEAGNGKRNSPKDRVMKNVESTSKDETVCNKKADSATKIGVSAVVPVAAAISVKAGDQSSQQDDSLVPQVGGATTESARLRSLGFEANDTTLQSENENSIIIDDGDATKERPLGRQDSLQQKYRVSKAVSPYDLSNLDRIAHKSISGGGANDSVVMHNNIRDETVNRSSKHDTDSVVVHDDGEEVNNNSPRVKRVTFAENIVEEDVHAHDILHDINAAAAVKRLSMEVSQTDRKTSHTDSALSSPTMDIIDDENSINPSEEAKSGIHKADQEGVNFSHGILNAIGEAAKRTQSSTEEVAYIPNDPPGDEGYVTTKKDDPPGDDIFVSKDDATIETDVFSGLRNDVQEDDGASSTYGATPIGCGSNIIQQTKEIFLCKQVRLRGQQQQQASSIMKTTSYRSSSTESNPKEYYSTNTPPIVSDDEDDSEIDLEEETSSIHRPWKDRWNMDPYANQTSSQRLTCSTPETGSNYDPDSDWDVSDTEVDFVVVDDEMFATRNLRSNNNRIK